MKRGGPPTHVSEWLPLRPGEIAEASEVLAQVRARVARDGAPPAELPARSPSAPPEPTSAEVEKGEQLAPAGESPLERFERLAEEFRRETGLLAPGKDAPPGADTNIRERTERWATWLRARRLAGAGEGPLNDGREDVREAVRPRPDPDGNKAPLERPEPAQPQHEPKACSSCGQPILWAQTLDEQLRRVRRDDGKGWKSMPVDFTPSLDGNVQVFHRRGEGIVCRVYRNAAAAPAGAILRTSHFATCPNAAQHRRRKRR